VTFQNSNLTIDTVKVRAFNSDEAIILAQAERINAAKDYSNWIGVWIGVSGPQK
jgi:hypothetical protein